MNVECVMNVEWIDSDGCANQEKGPSHIFLHSTQASVTGAELQFFTVIRTAVGISACFYTRNI